MIINIQTLLEKSIINKKTQWDRIEAESWTQLDSPWRPSRKEVGVYRKMIKILNPTYSLLLGSTPEIRNIFSITNKQLFVVDSSYNMIVQMQKLLSYPNKSRAKETWYTINWLEMNFPKSSFDLITGDLLNRLIQYDKQELFFKKISLLLKRDGYFLTRIHYLDDNIISIDTINIVKKLIGLYNRKVILKKEFHNLLTFRLLDKLTDPNSHCVKASRLDLMLSNILNSSCIIDKEIIRETLCKYGKGTLVYTHLNREETETILNKYFYIIKRYFVNDYQDAKLNPIILLKKKNNYK